MVSPAEIARTLSAADHAVLTVAERDIDAYLQSEYGNKSEIWIAIRPAWCPRIRDELMRRYVAAGWHVREAHDQRDGDALVFMVANG